RPLVAFDCVALSAETLETALFGAGEPETSTTGRAPAPGTAGRPRLAVNDGSTLLLGEILALPPDLQARLVAALHTPAPLPLSPLGGMIAAEPPFPLPSPPCAVPPPRCPPAAMSCRCWHNTSSSASTRMVASNAAGSRRRRSQP